MSDHSEVSNYAEIEKSIQQVVGGARRPIAIAFVEAPPAGVEKFEGSEPSSCSFWRLAAAGRTFYTVPADHQNCPIGGYTHNLLEPARMPELEQTLTLMSGIGYLRMEEVAGVFHLDQAAKFVVYSPLSDAPVAPSVVIASGKPAGVMLLAEAATRAGEMSNLPMLGRPTCMTIPAAMANGAVASTGCIGNRVYTGLGDDEFYITLRGATLQRVTDEIATIESANQALTAYHRERRGALSTV
jgi:uncharacterized protein (DUF169 family)